MEVSKAKLSAEINGEWAHAIDELTAIVHARRAKSIAFQCKHARNHNMRPTDKRKSKTTLGNRNSSHGEFCGVTNMKFNTVLRLPSAPRSGSARSMLLLRTSCHPVRGNMQTGNCGQRPNLAIIALHPSKWKFLMHDGVTCVGTVRGLCQRCRCLQLRLKASDGVACRELLPKQRSHLLLCSHGQVADEMTECPGIHSQDLIAESQLQYPQCEKQKRVQRSIGSATKWQKLRWGHLWIVDS